MSRPGRREFCRALGGLACFGLGGCKIEPILGIEDEDERALLFPTPPPQIPDQLEDAETTLRELTRRLLETELPALVNGGLRERPAERPVVVSHLVELMRNFGLDPAGNRGGWLQPVMLDIVEPTGDLAHVRVRPQSEPPPAPPPALPNVDPGTPAPDPATPASDPATPAPDPATPAPDPGTPAPDPGTPAPGAGEPRPDNPGAPPTPTDAPLPSPDAPPSRAIDLASLGAFRQRGDTTVHEGLQLSPLLTYETPLPSEPLVGRVALLRAPKNFDLGAEDTPARIEAVMSAARDAGAIGCLLLTRDDGPVIEHFRERWRREIRRAGTNEETLLIEGLLVADARAPLEAALKEDEPWVLDLDLARRHYSVESHNILGRVTGREHPDEAVVLTCNWDTPDPAEIERDGLRLLSTLGAFFQLAEWSRRSAPPSQSLILLLTADVGLSAGQTVHANWSANYSAKTTALVALDQPMRDPLPARVLAGRYDASIAKLAARVVAADGRELLLDDQLTLPSLATYLRYPAPVLTIGAPTPEALDAGVKPGSDAIDDGDGDSELDDDPLDGLYADVRLLRNLMLALAARTS